MKTHSSANRDTLKKSVPSTRATLHVALSRSIVRSTTPLRRINEIVRDGKEHNNAVRSARLKNLAATRRCEVTRNEKGGGWMDHHVIQFPARRVGGRWSGVEGSRGRSRRGWRGTVRSLVAVPGGSAAAAPRWSMSPLSAIWTMSRCLGLLSSTPCSLPSVSFFPNSGPLLLSSFFLLRYFPFPSQFFPSYIPFPFHPFSTPCSLSLPFSIPWSVIPRIPR